MERVPQRHTLEPHPGTRQQGDTVGSDQGLMWQERGVNVERASPNGSEPVGLKNHMSITDGEVQKMTAINFNVGRDIGDEGGWRRSSAADIFQHVQRIGIGHRRGSSLQREESP
ncbi:Endocytosis protein [Venturia nashicola]|uniref:Endocytosis protein n=1 Tax=Venturia nashicola TaxID=86259 RepID=A0A4Z1P110_9PEZI|nr:Endocytosis protein [Venturia nashicola]